MWKRLRSTFDGWSAVAASLALLAIVLLLLVATLGPARFDAWISVAFLTIGAFGIAGAWLIQYRVAAEARNELASARKERRLMLESVEATPTPFALYDDDDRLVASNASYRALHDPAFSRLTPPISYRDLMLAVARQILPPDKVEAAVAERLAAHRAGDGAPIDRLYPGGRWLRVHKMRTPSGAIAGFASDVTELKLREAELVASEARLRDFVETASDWFWETDAALRVFFASAKPEAPGIDPQQWRGRTLAEIIRASNTDPARAQAYLDIIERRAPFREIMLEVAVDGAPARHIALSATPVGDAGGGFAGYRGVVRDVTQSVAGARALQTALERAEIANRSKSEFLANMSHELRTPLNAIIGFSDMMRSGATRTKDIARYEAYAGDIHRSGLHLLDLINDLLDLSKIEAGKMELKDEPVDVGRALMETLAMMRDQIDRAQLKVEVKVELGAEQLLADDRSLRQIAINLISNALKFTPAGGRVSVTAWRTADAMLRLSVRDTGIGIAREDMTRLMQPFVQVGSAYGRRHRGTGLGLTLVRTLVELHGGRVSIESEVDHGTTVHVDFPDWRAHSAARTAARHGA